MHPTLTAISQRSQKEQLCTLRIKFQCQRTCFMLTGTRKGHEDSWFSMAVNIRRHGSISFDDCIRLFDTLDLLFCCCCSSFFKSCSAVGFLRWGGLLFDLAFLQTGHAHGARGVLECGKYFINYNIVCNNFINKIASLIFKREISMACKLSQIGYMFTWLSPTSIHPW